MNDDKAAGPAEIVIVRRRGGDDAAGGKGGSWKIAYADFVTAMMAFFLVMWLINASNEETRAQVASYFNPIKLTDSSTGARGLKSSKETRQQQKHEGTGNLGGSPPLPSDVRREAELMADPAKALDEIDVQVESLQSKNAAEPGGETERGASVTTKENEAPGVGDPFDPKSWEEPPPAPVRPATSQPAAEVPVRAAPEAEPSAGAGATHGATAEAAASAAKEAAPPLPAIPPPEDTAARAPETEAEAGGTSMKTAPDEAAEIAEDLARALGTGLDELPASIAVRSTDEGTLISLTDSQSFGMFKTGSSEPEPEMVRLVDAIASVLQARPGYIVVRGHTDARPYRNTRYDNWQLSTARAHFAHYMLIRGGLDSKRIRRIEGLADRDLRNPADPQAPENRRIEVLLGRDGS